MKKAWEKWGIWLIPLSCYALTALFLWHINVVDWLWWQVILWTVVGVPLLLFCEILFFGIMLQWIDLFRYFFTGKRPPRYGPGYW
jgi:hypothetical protein